MNLYQLELILCDLYPVDAAMPPMLGKTRNDFKIMSYRKWAVNEFEIYILNGLEPHTCGTINDLRDLTKSFINRMNTYSTLNERTSDIFQVASIIGNDILEVLDAMS